MRPICSNINAPTAKVAKWLLNEFNKLGRPLGKYVIDNLEFVNQIKDTKLTEGEALVSFDVQALFPSVPIKETIQFLREWLVTKNIERWKLEMYIELTEVCMNQNVFQFKKETFKQIDGTSMGNSLSPFLANLFMCHFETKISCDPNFPRIWIRYVDDVFAIQKVNTISDTLNLLNNEYESIKFTHEVEAHSKLSFLDLTLIRKGEVLELDIYRKPTHTPRFIPVDSFHDTRQKYAPFESMIHRMYNVPLREDKRDKERKLIMELAEFNGLDREKILRIMEKTQLKFRYKNETSLKNEVESDKRRFIKLTFYPKITDKLRPIFKKHNINTAFSSSLKLKNVLGTTKDKIENNEKSGVYEIKCKGCDFSYIGMTKRRLDKRMHEHFLDIKNCTEKTALSRHIRKENNTFGRGRRRQRKHEIIEGEAKIVKEVYDYRKLCIWESMTIIKNKEKALNDNNGLVDTTLTRIAKRH